MGAGDPGRPPGDYDADMSTPGAEARVPGQGDGRGYPETEPGNPAPLAARVVADPNLEETLRGFSDLRYRDLFWPGRRYEDRADRIALRAFLPHRGTRLLEVGAGFGRLAAEYAGYDEVVLLDASEPLLGAARERLGTDSRFRIVVGDAFRLPFPDATFDAAVCIRVVHHFEDPRPAIRELARILRPGGTLVLESANRRNVRAILEYVLRRGVPSPFARGSVVYAAARPTRSFFRVQHRAGRIGTPAASRRWFSTSSYLHAPGDVRGWLRSAGLRVEGCRSVGTFRLPLVTSHVPIRLLVGLERVAQPLLGHVTAGPSVVYRAVRQPDDPTKDRAT